MIAKPFRFRRSLVQRVGLVILCLVPVMAWAASESSTELNWLKMAMELFGGLALFLFGMEQMSDGLKAAAGDQMKILLSKLTRNRFSAAITGAFVTSVIQSSSVTTVLVVGFVSAGLMTMSQSIGVIMGANVGTTITAQIVAFKVTKAALLMIAVGFGMLFMSKKDNVQQYGNMLMGLGLIFFGMGVMSDGMSPLRTYEPFINLMATMENPVLGILVAAAFTALVQSSSATTGIVIVMASQGFITLPAGIALAFGANIGTCITAILASLGKPVEARRASLVHVIFNVAGVVLWILFIPQLANVVMQISPVAEGLGGTDKLAAEVPRQIANAHTIFNIANTLIFIGFTTQLGRIVEKLVPEKVVVEKAIIRPKYLDEELIETPSIALDMVRLELGHLTSITEKMLKRLKKAFQNRDIKSFENIAKIDDQVDILHAEITGYLRRLTVQNLTEEENDLLLRYLQANAELERIGDVIETSIVEVAIEVIKADIEMTETSRVILRDLYKQIKRALALVSSVVVDNDEVAAQNILRMKDEINQLVFQALQVQAQRMRAEGVDNIDVTHFENELIDSMKRIYSLTKRIARLTLPSVVVEESA
ncbi:MAG: Na/Pi cotransporter family protein [Gammaproteobacteria bacterium]|nr:Na/Pi cotransporter family protein [Gammaproteobacteria bacterium]